MYNQKYHIQTFGCQMNKSDSERLMAVLENMGLKATDDAKKADIILLNTCSVRQTAEDRVYGLIKNYGELKKKKPDLLLGITGCMVGHDKKKKLLDKMPMVDLYFPISAMETLPLKISELRHQVITDKELIHSPIGYLKHSAKYENAFEAFVPIMSGCNKFCTYCIVPYARGREHSRTFKDVLNEIKILREKGYQQVILLGQNVNSFNPADHIPSKNNPYNDKFAALLWEINRIGIPWVHFTAPHPKDMTDEVIDALALPCMIDYLHLPLQSGDDEILEHMNRGYTATYYKALIKKIRKTKPDIALGTDIIVGFPGETERQFENTINLYKEVGFDISYHAIYSPRPLTPAAIIQKQIDYTIKKKRWNRLQNAMERITEKKNKKYKGTTEEVLIKEKTKKGFVGETRHLKKITVPLLDKVAQGIRCTITILKTSTWMLYGRANIDKS